VIASNPPYIPDGEFATLPPEVRREPRAALLAGADGLDVIRRLVEDARPLLGDDGALVLEIGAGQAPSVLALCRAARYDASSRRDLAGHERIIVAKK
jgi:release factor glutamine methyltransferase